MEKVANTILEEIIAARLRRVEQAKSRVPVEELRQAAERRSDFRNFRSALSGGGLRVIAEMKKASPSAGLLRKEYLCAEIARSYAEAGASALSVLTEEDYFQGSLEHLREARKAASLPVLRKDFIVDDYQVYESVAAGADALLLIVAALVDEDLRRLLALCERLKVAALVEVHTEEDLARALDAGASIIGVNNRDLKTLEVSLDISSRLRGKIPAGRLAVSESGIRTAQDLRKLNELGYHAALIGEHFMKAKNPGQALSELLEGMRRENRL